MELSWKYDYIFFPHFCHFTKFSFFSANTFLNLFQFVYSLVVKTEIFRTKIERIYSYRSSLICRDHYLINLNQQNKIDFLYRDCKIVANTYTIFNTLTTLLRILIHHFSIFVIIMSNRFIKFQFQIGNLRKSSKHKLS